MKRKKIPLTKTNTSDPRMQMKTAPARRKAKSLNLGGRLPTQQTVEIHENLERKRLKAASIKKAAGKELKQTGITTKISKQRPHKFILAKNISKSVTRASRCTATTNQNKN